MDGFLVLLRSSSQGNGLNEIEERSEPRLARDVAPGERWAFLDHRTMAEVIAAERRP